MSSYKTADSTFTERDGVNYVATIVNEARCFWREVMMHDIGIDGHIEYVTPEGYSPGRLVAVQVKSGPSYFDKGSEDEVYFYPQPKHQTYWADYPLPVILILHNSEEGVTIWADAREQLRANNRAGPIKVPRSQVMNAQGVRDCLATTGPLPSHQFNVDDVIQKMAMPGPSVYGLSYLSLFSQGMTDIAYSLYFSMELVTEIVEFQAVRDDHLTFGIGRSEFQFIDSYVDFLIEYDLARVDYGAWKQVEQQRQMVGTFIAPLTEKGIAVKDKIGELVPGITTERPVRMLYDSFTKLDFNQRQEHIIQVMSDFKSL